MNIIKSNKEIIGILFFFCCVEVAVYLWKRHKEKKQEQIIHEVKKKKNSWNYLYPFYLVFKKTPFFRKSFEKLEKRVKLIYPAEIVEINMRVTKDMLLSLVFALSAMLLFIATAADDIYYICLGAAMSYILYTHIINSRYEAAYQKLLYQFKFFISDVRHNYYISNKMVDDAVYQTIDECPYEMSLHASKMHSILSMIPEDMNKSMDRYSGVAPNKFVLSFMAIATSVVEYGDKILKDGVSMFLTSIGFIKDEVHNELEKMKQHKRLFAMRTLIAVLPICLIKPMQWWANSFLPEIKSYYTGVYGITCEVITFLLAIGAYVMVMNLKDQTQKEIKNHSFLRWLSEKPIISPILTREVNRNFSKTQRMNDKLKLTGEHMGYKQFLLKQILYAIAFFVGFQLLIIGAQWQEKNNILTDYAEAFNTSFVSADETKEQLTEVSKMYLQTQLMYESNFDRDALVEDVMENTPVKKKVLAELVADTVVEKVNSYSAVYYRWYFLLISIGLAVIGFFVPNFLLNYRIKSASMGMADEVNHFQTIVMMLMHVDNMSIKIILEWMERFSYCFKESIVNCINELPFNEEKALKKMRDSETFEPFKRFINNMLVVNEQGLEAAFDEIVSDRKNAIEERKSDNLILMEKKSTQATLICMIPLIFFVIFYLIYPISVYAGSLKTLINI